LSITTGSGADEVEVAADDSVVSTGAGNDTITLTSGDDTSADAGAGDDTVNYTAGSGTYAGGDGTDTLVLADAEDLSGSTLSGFEIVTLDDATDFLASQVSGQTWVVTDDNAGSINIDNADSVDLSTIDLSGLVMSATTLETTTDLSNFDAGVFLSTQDFTFIGSSVEDNVTGSDNDDTISGNGGDDVLDGGDGADTITGGAGADTITGGAGADVIDLTEATAATDDVNIGVTGTDGIDVITGFTAGALADGGDTIGFLAADALNDLSGEDYSAADDVEAAATLAIVDDNDTNATDGDNDAIAFSYGGDTYVVIQTDGDAAAFDDTADAIVNLGSVEASDLVIAQFIA